MVHVGLPFEERKRLVWYLAMEEYIAGNISRLVPATAGGEREAFFLWRVSPTVIFGRNQVLEAEVNTEYCLNNGISLYRRKSGGGCVYADMGNLMISYVSDGSPAFTFERYLQRLALALRRLGLDAGRSGRNDVLVGGKKVSGNALFKTPSAVIVHGTLLYDVNPEIIQKAITPSASKIQSKGIESVRQRVTNLKGELAACGKDLSFEGLVDYLTGFFKGADGSEIILSPEDISKIDEIEKSYLEPSFIQGGPRKYSMTVSGRTSAGELEVSLDIDKGLIKACHLSGDFFSLEEHIDPMLTNALMNCPLQRPALEAALEGIKLESEVLNMDKEELINLIINN